MTIADERSFVDANILVYAALPAMPQYEASRALLESYANLCLSPQVLAEFYSVVTNPRRVTAPFTAGQASAFIRAVLLRVDVLPALTGAVLRWVELAAERSITGPDVFDVQLVATMLEHGVRRIYTYNRADFETFGELEVVTP